MLRKLLVDEARRRAEVFGNLERYLRTIAEVVKRLDEEARVYLFGSVAEGRNLMSSDVDVLVVTNLPPGIVLSELWRRGIKDPFEVHVVTERTLKLYGKRGKLVEVG